MSITVIHNKEIGLAPPI